ncbi:MAG: hypothetical protein HYY01_01310 [Chloroflexi bacterium]|nr:hypothetical protein [Chloroflexota bacterium]
MLQTLRITVVDDSRNHQHGGDCGMGCAFPETWGFLRNRLHERFQGAVELEYVDLAQPGMESASPELVGLLSEHNTVLPVIAFDGAVRLAGVVDYRTIVEAIETEWEVRRGQRV